MDFVLRTYGKKQKASKPERHPGLTFEVFPATKRFCFAESIGVKLCYEKTGSPVPPDSNGIMMQQLVNHATVPGEKILKSGPNNHQYPFRHACDI